MSIIGWIILGGVAGWIASALTGSGKGCLTDIVVGVVGAVLGGFLFSFLGHAQPTRFNLMSLFVAVVGSVILLVVLKAARRA
jgi:uncharacterized membrane protein YeaQ/YmgE (transglycosylase-associated protein family)